MGLAVLFLAREAVGSYAEGFMSPSNTPTRELVRGLTLIPAVSVILANIIGTGVFVKSRVMICNVETPGMVMLVWVVAGLLSLAGALTYSELASMMPRAGGEVHFLGAAYGRPWAFLFGWTKSLALGASNAATAIVFVIFLNDVLGGALAPWLVKTLPLVVLMVCIGLNLLTIHTSGWMATALSVIKISLVLGVGVGAFVLGDGAFANFGASGAASVGEGVPESARGGIAGFGAAMLGALWGYNGWVIIASLGGEVRDPGRTLPRALIGGTALVMAFYLLINAAYFYILTPVEVGSIPEDSSVAREALVRFGGRSAASIFSVGLVISAYGTLHSGLLSGPRIPFTMARQGLLPKIFGELSAHAVPAIAVIAIGVWSLVLTLSGTYDMLTDIYIFVLWVFYGLTGAAVFVLRRKWPDVARPYRTLGYPVVPALFLLVTAFLLINTVVATPWRAFFGVALILTGLPAYAYFSRKLGPDSPEAWRPPVG